MLATSSIVGSRPAVLRFDVISFGAGIIVMVNLRVALAAGMPWGYFCHVLALLFGLASIGQIIAQNFRAGAHARSREIKYGRGGDSPSVKNTGENTEPSPPVSRVFRPLKRVR
jgi:hypothetical protein